MKLLRRTDIYFPGQSANVWETKIILLTEGNGSTFLKIDKSPNQGTGIYSYNNSFRNDDLGGYS